MGGMSPTTVIMESACRPIAKPGMKNDKDMLDLSQWQFYIDRQYTTACSETTLNPLQQVLKRRVVLLARTRRFVGLVVRPIGCMP
jgi:hypothetical protein